jgi:hypothetical protein
MSPSDYGLSIALTDRLDGWNQIWADNFDSASGWSTLESREKWALLGEGIIRDLRTEVYWIADVVYEPWPL